jgi:hypothetical protein
MGRRTRGPGTRWRARYVRSGGHSRCCAGIHGNSRTCPDLGRSSSDGRGPQPSKEPLSSRSASFAY